MKIACEACGAKYTIADDKVRGRKVKIRCKGCGTPIVVDGQNGGEPNTSDAETDAALESAEATVTWSVNLSDTDSRTMSAEEIVEAYASGVVTADAFVWKDGMGDWVPLLESELAALLPTSGGAASSGVGAAGAADAANASGVLGGPGGSRAVFGSAKQAAAGSRSAAVRASQPDHDLFGGASSAGAEDEIATSAPVLPQAGTSAHDDGKLTGARNENSVLFSLDALKAGFSPTASPSTNSKAGGKPPAKSAPGAPRPQQASNPDDPFGMGSGNGLLGIGGTGGVLFGADNHALLTAPAPPPPVQPTPAQLAAGVLPTAAPKSNKLVYAVGGVGGVVIIGLLLALLLGKKPDAAPTAEGSATANAAGVNAAGSPKPSAGEQAKPEVPNAPVEATSATAATGATPASSSNPASSASSASPASSASSASAATSASTPPAAKAADKPSGGPTASPIKKAAEPSAPAADAPPFSKASAISALGAAASAAGSCKKPGGPTGAGKATVTFAPSGRVTTATVAGGSYSGTAVGGCVASVFRRAHVPAFSGSSVTVSKSFQIN